MADRCPVEERLAETVSGILTHLIELTTAQLHSFREHRDEDLSRLDKELENAMGEKERAIGALDEHRKEHWCFQRR